MFRSLIMLAIGTALFGHAQWGCIVCHSHAHPIDALAAMDGAGEQEHDHDGHSHSGTHDQKPRCTSDNHCYFMLRLPSGSELVVGSPVATAMPVLVADFVTVDFHSLVATADSVDPGPMLSASRRAQHIVLLT